MHILQAKCPQFQKISPNMELINVIGDLIDLFEKRDHFAIVVYQNRQEEEAKISYTASTMELVNMAATVAAVAAQEVASQLHISEEEATKMVADAVAEKNRFLRTSGRIKTIIPDDEGNKS